MIGENIENVVIVGGGTAGWMAAAAFARFLDNGRRTITLIESDEIGIVGVGEATIPPIQNFNAKLGLNESEFLRATQGTFKLGIEFRNWGRQGDSYFHPFGELGHDLQGVPFHQLWLREQGRGGLIGAGPGPIGDYSMAGMAAAKGGFARPSAKGGPALTGLRYAFHFDAALYARYLRAYAESHGAQRREGKITTVHRNAETGFVESVQLENGTRIEGELFVDCSGFCGLLIEQALGTGFEDWSHWLPMDRAWAVPTANTGPPAPFTRSTAHAAGWQWRIPLQHRTGNGHVFASRFIDEEGARQTLVDNVEGAVLAEPRLLRFVTGRRKQAWNFNVVALGLSSGFIEPLESTAIHLVQNGISRLLALFPDKGFNPLERDEYNRGMREAYEDVRDFIILHYKATQRDDTEFWRYVRDMDIPESLARRIELFAARGRVFCSGAELFATPSWVAVMLGQNIVPRAYDTVVDALDENKVAQALRRMRQEYAEAADALPSHEDFLRRDGAWADPSV
ncbi:tryptophan halogenase family protein [Sphingopyxis sp.]|uniref:tryptophan halogenase family protein n=1 Tax=Sphingopyxis sp. TaxID=1908224 RepID=UPI002B4916CA|nr:tryptophan halogenase family protein [Sphingopyxis sp.]HJS13231.1 tryptophan halogenase family protein [Sphingopyxis sp.]